MKKKLLKVVVLYSLKKAPQSDEQLFSCAINTIS